MANRITTIPHRLANWRARMEKRPLLSAAALGACLGIVSSFCSVILLPIALRLLPPEQWGNSAAVGLDGSGPGGIFLAAVVFAPLIETLLGQLIPVEIAHRLGANALVCVLLSALVFGGGHVVNGGLVHGISSFFAGLVFACAYAGMRWSGIGRGFVAAGAAHAVHNMVVIFLIAPLLPPPI
ncbi:MAG: CPBP family intramembrane metalloprotease [Massilia sp.]|nr:MAG: CPBP family intramembrane metalloprotease [Massilia sp.]